MKKIFFLLCLFPALVSAQSDTIHLHFKAKHMGFITAVVRAKGDADMVKVFNQAASQLQVVNGQVQDTAQMLTVVAKTAQVPKLFLDLGGVAERLATNYNNEMRDFLLQDLQRNIPLLMEVDALMQRNWAETWLIAQEGLRYLIEIKQN